PDGKKVLYNRLGFPWFRPRYQGSAAAQIWVYDLATGQRQKVRANGFQHLWPNWSHDGREIYTVTVTEKTPSSSYLNKPIPKVTYSAARTPNVYEIGLNGSAKRTTGFVSDGARFLTTARKADVIAFEQDGDIYVGQKGAEPRKILVTASIDDKTPQEERLILTDGASDMDLSPKAEQIVFAVRGELWQVPVKKEKGPNADDASQLTDWEGVDGDPLHSPDGKSVYFLSDREGQMRLYKMVLETKATEPVSKTPYDVGQLRITPDKKSLSYWQTGKEGGLYLVPLAGGEPKKVFGRSGSFAMDYDWSPDGRYVAYSDTLTGSGYYYWEATTNVFVYDTTTGKAENVTKLSAEHSSPRWSPDGKYLFFRSNRSGPGLYVLPLQKEDQPANLITLAYVKPKDPVKVEIDWEDIEQRSRRLISGQGSPVQIDRENGDLYYVAEGDVWKANYNGEEAKRVTNGGGVSSFGFSQEGQALGFIRNGLLNLVEVRKPNTPTTAVAFRADWTRDVRAERRAAYAQFWREYNRSFYDPNFHGRDWLALRGKYEKYLSSVGHRNEMATVLNMLVGELESSHSEAGSGPGNPRSQSSANLGFLIDYSYDGPGLKVKDVPYRAPGSYPKSRLNPGDIVTKINGKDVRADEALYRDVLNEQTGRDLNLTVRNPAGEVRQVKYRAISGGEFGNIIWSNRLEARRKYVEEKSGGKLTYVHIAGMGGSELDRFNQQVWQYAKDKKGLIIDVRNNGGGNTSDRIIDVLERRANSFYQVRDEDPIQGPGQALGLPMVVMHAESSFSNAEMFPYAMRARGLATLVGMPTPGYVIYTGGFRLVDGTSARMPGTGVYRLDGSPLENMGQEPDVKVDISPEEYFAGKDPQLDKAIEVLLKKVS
ncbi:MAG TPA: S41 family peptidase, partial [Fimbriimonas sp.]